MNFRIRCIVAVLSSLSLACGEPGTGVAGAAGPKGDKGDTGAQGPAGVQGPKGDTGPQGPSATGNTDCPNGYTRDASAADLVLCKNGADEMVKVGAGASAFWVDRYEATVWSSADGTGTLYGLLSADYPATFPRNGQGPRTGLLFAVSRSGSAPSSYLTWFQANRACRASGKALPSTSEWIEAAAGTVDPGSSNGQSGACLTAGTARRATGLGSMCASEWGAQDMVGNLDELTQEWFAAPGNNNNLDAVLSAEFNQDVTANIASSAWPGNFEPTRVGLPAVAARGGNYLGGTKAGVFALRIDNGVTNGDGSGIGFRCVIR